MVSFGFRASSYKRTRRLSTGLTLAAIARGRAATTDGKGVGDKGGARIWEGGKKYDLVVVHEGSGDGEYVEEKASRRKRASRARWGVGRVTAKTALPPYKTECASQYPANMLRLRARLTGTAPTPRCVFSTHIF